MSLTVNRSYISKFIKNILDIESVSGILMIIAACAAMIIANSDSKAYYHLFLNHEIKFQLGNLIIDNSVHTWINEFLMSFFFMIVGLEIKKEFKEGSLSNRSQIVLPLIAAISGVIVPAIIYYIVNYNHPHLIRGIAIPIVTDIAFALCILSFFSKIIPSYLKIFLLSLAIFDDLIGIIVIAIFYTKSISLYFLILSIIVTFISYLCNLKKINNIVFYILIFSFLWYFLLKSGIHATIAGVIIAFSIPLKSDDEHSPLKKLMNILHPWVSYFITPLFAFANSGIELTQFTFKDLLNPLPLGIILGLFVGKQLGIFSILLILIKTKLVKLDFKFSWLQLYGISVLTGIGFTVSLFIGELSFIDLELGKYAKIGILAGSILSALWGFVVLKLSSLIFNKNIHK